MTQTVNDGFGVQDEKVTREIFATESSKPDELWVSRLAPIPVGQSFTANRPESETARAFKKRINKAAMVHFKSLEWKARDTNLPEGVEATHWIAKVKAIDLKAKAEAEQRATTQTQTSPNGSNTAQEAPETSEPENKEEEPNPNENAPQARVRGR